MKLKRYEDSLSFFTMMQFDTFILLQYKGKIQSIKIIITKLHKFVQKNKKLLCIIYYMLQNPNTDRQQQIESCYNELNLEIKNNFHGIGIT